jgi:peptide/nickel transport system substrate-binding protein
VSLGFFLFREQIMTFLAALFRMCAACAIVLAVPAQSVATGVAAAEGRKNSWTTPHELTISDAGDVITLNPHLSQSASVANLSEMTMAWLVRWDKHNQPYPELAMALPTRANGGVSSDGRTITYHLRKGVVWSDGAPFTSADVVFSANAVNNPANNEGGRFDQLASVAAPDDFTVVFHLKKPYATFVEAFFSSCCANPSLLPKHLLGKYANINDAPYNALPVGIGPFTFARWDRSKQVVLAANPRYWRGRPKLDRIVYKIVSDRDTLLANLVDHKVDLWYQFSGAYLDRVAALPGFTVVRQPSFAYDHFDFNLAHAAVADRTVRQALMLALDRKSILSTIAHGVGIVRDAPIPVSAPFYTDLGTTPYDPAKANALLDSAGWVRGADGIRAKNGVRLDLRVAVSAGQNDTDRKVDFVRANWQQIGVNLQAKHYPPAQMFAPAQQGGIIYGGAWDVVLFAFAVDPLGDYSGLYGCDQFPPVGQNNVRWCNKTAQAAMDAFIGHYQPADRNADIKVVMQAFIDDVPSIVASIREDLFGYNSDLRNYDPNTITPFDNMMNVDI